MISHHPSGSADVNPMRIAHHPLFTPREKLDLLRRLRAEVAAQEHFLEEGLSAGDIEIAMETVRDRLEDAARPSASGGPH